MACLVTSIPCESDVADDAAAPSFVTSPRRVWSLSAKNTSATLCLVSFNIIFYVPCLTGPSAFVHTESALPPVLRDGLKAGFHDLKQRAIVCTLQEKLYKCGRFSLWIDLCVNPIGNPSKAEVVLRLYPLDGTKRETICRLPNS